MSEWLTVLYVVAAVITILTSGFLFSKPIHRGYRKLLLDRGMGQVRRIDATLTLAYDEAEPVQGIIPILRATGGAWRTGGVDSTNQVRLLKAKGSFAELKLTRGAMEDSFCFVLEGSFRSLNELRSVVDKTTPAILAVHGQPKEWIWKLDLPFPAPVVGPISRHLRESNQLLEFTRNGLTAEARNHGTRHVVKGRGTNKDKIKEFLGIIT
ncbi:MAG: hypothetical protein ACPHK8_01480 [Thermoplasmatota archaeon]